MKNYEEKKKYLLDIQDYKCASCGREFKGHDKIDLAHKMKASKKNYQLFSELIIDHVFNIAVTHSNGAYKTACNDMQNRSRSSYPVESAERIIDIITAIVQGEPDEKTTYILKSAFENLDVTRIYPDSFSSTEYVGKYDILENLFKI